MIVKRAQYWFSAHWPRETGQLQNGLLIRRRKDEPRNEVKRRVSQLQELMGRGALVFVYETKQHGTNQGLKGKGKIVALLRVTDNSDFAEFEDRFIPVKETSYVAEVDCSAEVARGVTGIRQLGKAHLNFGYPLKGTRIQRLDRPQAARLLSYVCSAQKREKLLEECWPPEIAEEDGDEAYQERARQAQPADYEKGPRKAQFVKTAAGEQVRRDERIAKTRFLIAQYRCEIDSTHETFTSRSTNESFVEAHHLVPVRMKIQQEFGNSIGLDHESNIISLCPNCHRLLHHAVRGEKEDMLRHLYKLRKKELGDAGIRITMESLLQYYR